MRRIGVVGDLGHAVMYARPGSGWEIEATIPTDLGVEAKSQVGGGRVWSHLVLATFRISSDTPRGQLQQKARREFSFRKLKMASAAGSQLRCPPGGPPVRHF
jgi:hypothetical protein